MLFHRKFEPTILTRRDVLDIGCGRKKLTGAIGLDRRAFPGVDVLADLSRPLPFENCSFDVVHADQVFEHIDNLIGLMYEIFRVLRPGGTLVSHVPYFRSSWAHLDPSHVRSFTINTLDYFVKDTFCYQNYRFSDDSFKSIEVFIDYGYSSTITRQLFTSIALRYPFRFENSLLSMLFPFEQLTYVLKK